MFRSDQPPDFSTLRQAMQLARAGRLKEVSRPLAVQLRQLDRRLKTLQGWGGRYADVAMSEELERLVRSSGLEMSVA